MIEFCIEIKITQFRAMVMLSQALGHHAWAEHWARHIELWEQMR